MGTLDLFNFFCSKPSKQNNEKPLAQYVDIPALSKHQKKLLYNHFQVLLEQIEYEGNSFFNIIEEYLQFNTISLDMHLLTTKKNLKSIDIIDLAFLIGNTTLIDFVLFMNNSPLNSDLQRKAILCGNLSTLIYLETKGIPINSLTMSNAAEMGHLKTLKYCIGRGIQPNKDTLDDAALYGHIDILRYLIEERNIKPDRNSIDCTIIGAGLTSHRNRQAHYYLFNIVFPPIQNNSAIMCLK